MNKYKESCDLLIKNIIEEKEKLGHLELIMREKNKRKLKFVENIIFVTKNY